MPEQQDLPFRVFGLHYLKGYFFGDTMKEYGRKRELNWPKWKRDIVEDVKRRWNNGQ